MTSIDNTMVQKLDYVERINYVLRVYICGNGHRNTSWTLFPSILAAKNITGRYSQGKYIGPLPPIECILCKDTRR